MFEFPFFHQYFANLLHLAIFFAFDLPKLFDFPIFDHVELSGSVVLTRVFHQVGISLFGFIVCPRLLFLYLFLRFFFYWSTIFSY